MIPARSTPVSAPSVVVVSRTTASRMLTRPASRKGDALPHEQAITETILAPMAVRMSRCPNIVRMGTMKIPLAMPSIPPKALAPTEAANSHKPNPGPISLPFLPSPGQAGHGPDPIAPVIELFIIDRLVSRAVGGSLDPEEWASRFDAEGLRHDGFRGHGFQPVLGLDERHVVLRLQEREDRLHLQVVGDDLLAHLLGQ